MAWIRITDEADARGRLKDVYDAAMARAGKVFQILKVQSQNPEALEASLGMYRVIMFGDSPLSRVQREMLATVVSRANRCHY